MRNGDKYYLCEESGLVYTEKTWTGKCQGFCSKRHACSIEITKHAVQLDEDTTKL